MFPMEFFSSFFYPADACCCCWRETVCMYTQRELVGVYTRLFRQAVCSCIYKPYTTHIYIRNKTVLNLYINVYTQYIYIFTSETKKNDLKIRYIFLKKSPTEFFRAVFVSPKRRQVLVGYRIGGKREKSTGYKYKNRRPCWVVLLLYGLV